MNDLDHKINTLFPGLVVRKDLVRTVKGNAIVPTYVLEYLLGQYCATDDEATMMSGIETVKEILARHYVHRSEAGLVRSTIRERGRNKVIDKISVALNDRADVYEAEFSNLGIKRVVVDAATVKAHPKLLVSGVWCIADIEYEHSEETGAVPWLLASLKPIQLSRFDFDGYVAARRGFTTDEWIDLLIQSIGFNPELFGKRSKLTQLVRLIPFCERNYNLIELGPKGTGKSHIYSEFSPHGILISGGEVTVPKLFVNNATGRIGLVGFWDCVAFDEFAGKDKRADNALVDILKNYMANKSFSRGIETLGAEASMAFVGNTQHTVPHMLKHKDLFEDLPAKFYDSAFLDRIHFYIPGWEVDVIRGEMFSEGYGFVVNYLAEILRALRNHDYSDRCGELFTLSADLSTRDRDAIVKTFSGLMKLLFPGGGATPAEAEELLRFAMEGRKRVKDQLLRIDATYPKVAFTYTTREGAVKAVTTLEEQEYPNLYHRTVEPESPPDELKLTERTVKAVEKVETTAVLPPPAPPQPQPEAPPDVVAEELKEQHLTFQENQKGVSFDSLLGPYLKGALMVVVTDPYVRVFHQMRNLMELLETVVRFKAPEDEVKVHLATIEDDSKRDQQREYLERIKKNTEAVGIHFTFGFDRTATIHARHIQTDHGWKILLDRGLDIFQQFDMNDAFTFANRLQQCRAC
ncbi:MAG: BREX system Lon protease-like protein BrxL, partial [Methylobacteriaceae bacterium]|nr:BREX system Lon protease-like protein BrxL [Methylobacteriaceae bacterium]